MDGLEQLSPRPKGTRAGRPSIRLAPQQVYERYAVEFLGALQKEMYFRVGPKRFASLTPQQAAEIRDQIIKEGKYERILTEISMELQFALKGLPGSMRGGKILLERVDERVAAKLLQLSERISTINAMEAANFKASWDHTVKVLKTIMKTGPNSDEYIKYFITDASIDGHIAHAFKEAASPEDFIKRVLKFDQNQIVFELGYKTHIKHGLVKGKQVPYADSFSRAFGIKLMDNKLLDNYSPEMMALADKKAVKPGLYVYPPKTIPLWGSEAIPLWENCISLKALPDSAMKELGISAEEGARIAFRSISSSVEHGGAERLLAGISGMAVKEPIPFAGSILKEVPGQSAPPKVVPKAVLDKLKAKLPKGAAAMALFAISTAIAYSLMEKGKAGKSGFARTVPVPKEE